MTSQNQQQTNPQQMLPPRPRKHPQRKKTEELILGLRRLCQGSAPYVSNRLEVRHKKRQIRPQLLKVRQRVAFRVDVEVVLWSEHHVGEEFLPLPLLPIFFPLLGRLFFTGVLIIARRQVAAIAASRSASGGADGFRDC